MQPLQWHINAMYLQRGDTAVLGSLIEMDERSLGSSTLDVLRDIKGSVI